MSWKMARATTRRLSRNSWNISLRKPANERIFDLSLPPDGARLREVEGQEWDEGIRRIDAVASHAVYYQAVISDPCWPNRNLYLWTCSTVPMGQ
jgi:integrase